MKKFKIFWILSVLILFVLHSNGFSKEKEKKHPIDVWLEKCMEKENYTTAGMLNCSSQALDKWDKELNRVYKELMKKLSPEEKELLKQSQQQWIKFKDAEFKWIESFYNSREGTMFPVMGMGEKLHLVSERVKVLEGYLLYLKEAEEK
jgi:uncharacterized protein YecT (DUF1311 family)